MIGGVTISEVARKVGCDKSTVSRALRNHAGVDPRTAERIRAVAEKMGYRPDPVQAYAAARRWRNRSAGGSYAVSLLMPQYGDEDGAAPRRQRAERLASTARARLSELGCSLDVLNLSDYPSAGSLVRVLVARGVRGLIVPAIPSADQEKFSAFDWSRFTAVGCQIGWSLPPVHVVESDEHYGVQKAWRELVDRGYKRIGPALAAHEPWAEDDYLRHGAIAAERASMKRGMAKLPIFVGGTRDQAAFATWFKKVRPDAVIGFHQGMLYWLRDLGVRVPDDVAFVSLHAAATDAAVAGLTIDHDRIARTAVDLLMAQIRENLWGMPTLRQRVRLEPVWKEGESLPSSS